MTDRVLFLILVILSGQLCPYQLVYAQTSSLSLITTDNRSDYIRSELKYRDKEIYCKPTGARMRVGTVTRIDSGQQELRLWRDLKGVLQKARAKRQNNKARRFRKTIRLNSKKCKSIQSSARDMISDMSWWLDTSEYNDFNQDDSLFDFFEIKTERYLRTESDSTNIHSHYLGLRATPGHTYLYQGEMMIGEEHGGIGITFFSDYPNSDHYYRLRRYDHNSFHLAPHGTEISQGSTDTQVEPVALLWYSFKLMITANPQSTEILGKVWISQQEEPTHWQIEASDTSETRRSEGLFGVWSMGTEWKLWKNLTVTKLD